MKEKEFDELFQDTEMNMSLSKKIKRKMNRHIYSKIIVCMIVLCLGVSAVYYGYMFHMQKVIQRESYNPFTEETLLQGSKNGEFSFLLSTLVEMYFPGIICMADTMSDQPTLESLKAGQYQQKMKIQRSFDQLHIDGRNNVLFTIDQSKMTFSYTTENQYLHTVDAFKDKNNKHFQDVYSLEDIYNDVKELPSSSYIDASISFQDDLSLEQVIQLIQKYQQSQFVWLALRTNQQSSKTVFGMSLHDYHQSDLTKATNQKYPHFYLPEINHMTAQILQQNYLSRLKLLIDHPEFLKVTHSAFSDGLHTDVLKGLYQDAQKEMQGIGVRVYLKKQDLLNMIDKENISYVMIHDVKLSKYQQ